MKERIGKALIFAAIVTVFWNVLDVLFDLVMNHRLDFGLYNNLIAPFAIGLIVELITGKK